MRAYTTGLLALSTVLAASPQILFEGTYAAKIELKNEVQTSVWPRPPVPPVIIDLSDKTIAQILNDSLHHHNDIDATFALPLHKLAYLVNISDATEFKEKLADEKAHLTFLAPDDRALTPPDHQHGPPHHGPPHHGPPHHGPPHDGPPHDGPHHPPPHHPRGPHHGPHRAPHNDQEEMWRVISQEQESDIHPFHSKRFMEAMHKEDDGEDKRREEFRQRIRKIIGFVLRYHLIDGRFGGHELADKSTVASDLAETRIRIEPRPLPVPSLVFNFYAKTTGPVIKAKNGLIHVIGAPLLPPLPVLETLFVFPGVFSTLTSGVQKVDLDISTFRHDSNIAIGEGDDEVSSATMTAMAEVLAEHDMSSLKSFTVFAPTNFAFKKLGFKINAFLFSPFGKRILKAVLAYHVVPDVIFYSDFNINATATGTHFGVTPEIYHEGRESVSDLIEAGLIQRRCHGKKHHQHRQSKTSALMSWFKSFWFSSEAVSPAVRAGADSTPEVKITSYRLKTLFNDTKLPIDVFEKHEGLFGKGPLRRTIWVSAEEGRAPHSEVRVIAPDAVAFKGAIHVVNSIIRPPMPDHHHGEKGRDFLSAFE